MKTILIPALAAGFALSSVAALAQEVAAPARPTPSGGAATMGPMTREQHRQKAQQKFAQLDKDRNGSISQQEFMAAEDDRFAKMDTDNDGTVSPEEHLTHKAKADKTWQ